MAWQTKYKKSLALPVSSWDTTIEVSEAPTATEWSMKITQWNIEEWIYYTGVSWTTLTWVTRSLSKTAATMTSTWSWEDFIAGAEIKMVLMHWQLIDKTEATQSLQEAKTYADTTARDAALWWDWAATLAYTDVYTTAEWLHRNYNLSTAQWESVDTWTTTPNASATVAGKVEIATDAEVTASTDTWWTWATLSVKPSQLNPNLFTSKSSGITTSDKLLISDVADSNNPKSITINDIKLLVDLLPLTAWEDITAWEVVRMWRWNFSFTKQQLLSDTLDAITAWSTATVVSFTCDSDFTLDTVELYWEWQGSNTNVEVYLTDASDTILETSDTQTYSFAAPEKHTHTFTTPWTYNRDTTYKIRAKAIDNQFNYRNQTTLWDAWYYDADFSWTETTTKCWLTRASDTAQLWIVWFANETKNADETINIDLLVNTEQSWLTAWSTYYLSDTPWAIDTSAWSNTKIAWRATNATDIIINQFA